jgi:branched-chain amino acid aminotransferase
MKTIFIDGKYLEVDNKTIEAFTPGRFNAQGVFETMLGLDGVVFDVEDHLKRLRAGLKALKIKAPRVNPLIFKTLLRRNRLSCARVRIMVWQEKGDSIYCPLFLHVMACALPYQFSSKAVYRVCLVKTKRPANSRLAHVKSLDYAVFAQAHAQAQAQGFDEALLLNARGHIFEAGRANIFWIKDKILYTPPLTSGCLNGITRRRVMAHARRLKIPVKETHLTPAILREADTAFLTNSLMGIKPIETRIS